MRRLLPTALLALAGCPSEPEPLPEPADPVALAELGGWVRVDDPARDVFADQRPADAVCDDSGYYVDPLTNVLEVQTDLCNYPTLEQATKVALAPGDLVSLRGYHDVLLADAPAQGYLGLAIGGEIELEYTVAIPSEARDIELEVLIDRELPAGTAMQLHVHNHGPNTWELITVQATPAP